MADNQDNNNAGNMGGQSQDYADPVSTYNPFGSNLGQAANNPTGYNPLSSNATSLLGGGTPTRGTSDPSTTYNAPLSSPSQPAPPTYTPNQSGYGLASNSGVTGGSQPTAPPQGLVPQTPNQNPSNPAGGIPQSPWGNMASNPTGWATYMQQMQQYTTNQVTPAASGPPAGSASWTPTQWNQYYNSQPGGVNAGAAAAAPPANPFAGSNPYYANPTATGPGGTTTNYNPTYFPTANTAAIVSGMAPGSSVVTDPNGFLGAAGSPFTQNQPSQQVRLADGTIINPGNIANDYATYNDPSQARLLQSLVGGELGQAPLAGTYGAYDPSLGPGTAYGAPNPVGTPSTGGVQYPNVNPFTGQPIVQGAADILQGTPGNILGNASGSTTAPTSTTTTPSNTTTTASTSTSQPSAADMQSLQNALLFLQAYSGLGSGAGNPTAINADGQLGTQLGSVLTQMLSGLLGGQSLYNRQRQYPQFQ